LMLSKSGGTTNNHGGGDYTFGTRMEIR